MFVERILSITKQRGINDFDAQFAKKKKKSVTVSWKKAANAKGYRIALSKKKNGKYKKVTDTKKTKYTFKKTKGTYYVKLTAYVVKSDKATFSKATKPVKFKVK